MCKKPRESTKPCSCTARRFIPPRLRSAFGNRYCYFFLQSNIRHGMEHVPTRRTELALISAGSKKKLRGGFGAWKKACFQQNSAYFALCSNFGNRFSTWHPIPENSLSATLLQQSHHTACLFCLNKAETAKQSGVGGGVEMVDVNLRALVACATARNPLACSAHWPPVRVLHT